MGKDTSWFGKAIKLKPKQIRTLIMHKTLEPISSEDKDHYLQIIWMLTHRLTHPMPQDANAK